MPYNLIIYGPPLSGKSTQAELLTKRFDLKHVNIGELLRKRANTPDEFGTALTATLAAGHLAPSELVAELVGEEIRKLKQDEGIVFGGGGGRKREEAEALDLLMASYGRSVVAIELTLPQEEIARRAEKRTRAEDSKVARRLAIYHKETSKALDYFRSQGRLITVDGQGTIEEVHQRIVDALKGYS
ncbi:MAG: nucleoside monophosphate kinase [Parcubacteria group bacterium]|nr:nucleoside monophosphate kinase [Parcubacteria group bacterium]